MPNNNGYTLLPTEDGDDGVKKQPSSKARQMGSIVGPPGLDVVQFLSPWFYCNEDDGEIFIEVMRIGDLQTPCSVSYTTKDGSAKSGEKYVATDGMLEFAPGEHIKGFHVHLIDDDLYNTILTFEVVLCDQVNCALGNYLRSARVAILDDDYFPANDLKEVIHAGQAEIHKNSLKLIFSFCWHAYTRIPTIWWKSWLIVFLDLFQNLYYLLTIYIKINMVDSVLRPAEDPVQEEKLLANMWMPGSRHGSAVVLALMWVLPNFLITGTEFFKVRILEVGFSIRKDLRLNIFRKYLNSSVADEIPIYEIMVMVKDDVGELVDNGFLKIFELISSSVKILMVFVFLARKHPYTSLTVFIYPVAMLIFISFRRQKGLRLVTEQAVMESETLQLLNRTAEDQKEISNYNQRALAVQRFVELLDSQHHSTVVYRTFRLWNTQLVPWITLCAIGCYMIIGSGHVLEGRSSLGTFVATINIFKDLGDRFEGIYDNIRDLLNTADPLTGVTELLNMPTDISTSMGYYKTMRELAGPHIEEFRAKLSRGEASKYTNAFDSMDISIGTPNAGITLKKSGLYDAHASVSQGSLVVIEATHGAGKGQIARILAGLEQPDSGALQCGLHLRRTYVSKMAKPIDWVGLYGNLVFGSAHPDKERVRAIAEKAKLGPKLCKVLDEELKQDIHEDPFNASKVSSDWLDDLSVFQRMRLLLVRALVYNPEVLILHSPVDSLDDDAAATVLLLLREFVDNRGLEAPGRLEDRRPRTVFFTCGFAKSSLARAVADTAWEMKESCNDDGAPINIIETVSENLQVCHTKADLEALHLGEEPPSMYASEAFRRKPSVDIIAPPAEVGAAEEGDTMPIEGSYSARQISFLPTEDLEPINPDVYAASGEHVSRFIAHLRGATRPWLGINQDDSPRGGGGEPSADTHWQQAAVAARALTFKNLTQGRLLREVGRGQGHVHTVL